MLNIKKYEYLVGQRFVFDDGNYIEIFQIRLRDGNQPYVTYHVKKGAGIPQKLILSLREFREHYGHLFNIISDDNSEP